MLGSRYVEFEDGLELDTLEEALLTSCPYCGTELEYSLKVRWNNNLEIPQVYGMAHSCGVRFDIVPLEEGGYMLKEIYDE